MRTIAIMNRHGGCGKTTTAVNLASMLARKGYRTLLVDLDPQGHCAAALAVPERRVETDIGRALTAPKNRPVSADALTWRVARNLDLAPATTRLLSMECDRGRGFQKIANDELAKILGRMKDRYDIVVIDTPTGMSPLMFNALVAADDVIVPVATNYFAIRTAPKQIRIIRSTAKRLGTQVRQSLLAVRHNPYNALEQEMMRTLRAGFGVRLIPAIIREDKAIPESQAAGMPIAEYAADCDATRDYAEVADHLTTRTEIAEIEPKAGPAPLRLVRPIELVADEDAADRAAAPDTLPMPAATRAASNGAIPGRDARAESQRERPSLRLNRSAEIAARVRETEPV